MNIICICFFCEGWFTNLLSILALIVSTGTLVVCWRQLYKANNQLSLQIEQRETERKSKMESNSSNLILLLQELSINMQNLESSKLGGNFKESLFPDQRKIEMQILSLIADLKARTTNSQFVNLLFSIEDIVSSYWNISDSISEHAQKATAFQNYKTQLSDIIENFKNTKYEY